MDRTCLFVCHDFPPVAGSGPNRAVAFARYLPEYGWRPVVLTPRLEWAANRDDSTLADIPPALPVVRTGSFERRPRPRTNANPLAGTAAAAKLPRGRLSTLKSHVAHATRQPDAQVGWLPFAVAEGRRIIRRGGIDLIYTTSSPYTNHAVGLILHRLTGLPWVAELRDGWYQWNRQIFPDYPFWRNWIEGTLEATAFKQADRVVLVTNLMAQAFRRQYAASLPPERFAVVSNGYDPRPLEGISELPAGPADDTFEVLYAGSLYYGRSIEAFLDAAGRLADSDPAFKQRFHLRLVGDLDGNARTEILRQLGRHDLANHVRHDGFLEHRAALAAMRAASLLLVIVNTTNGAEATIPAKLYEYLAVGRPILAITPPSAEGAETVLRAQAGWVAPAGDPQAIAGQLAAAFRAHQEGRPFCPNQAEIHRYNRRTLAGDLATIFNDALARRQPSTRP